MLIKPMSTAACSQLCDYGTLSAAVYTYLIAAPLIVLVACVAGMLLRNTWRATVTVGLGLGLLLGIFWVTSVIADRAMLLS